MSYLNGSLATGIGLPRFPFNRSSTINHLIMSFILLFFFLIIFLILFHYNFNTHLLLYFCFLLLLLISATKSPLKK